MPACLESELCEIGDGRVGRLSCWMPPAGAGRGGRAAGAAAEGLLLLRVGRRAALHRGVRGVLRTRTHVRVYFACGARWELPRVLPARL